MIRYAAFAQRQSYSILGWGKTDITPAEYISDILVRIHILRKCKSWWYAVSWYSAVERMYWSDTPYIAEEERFVRFPLLERTLTLRKTECYSILKSTVFIQCVRRTIHAVTPTLRKIAEHSDSIVIRADPYVTLPCFLVHSMLIRLI